MTEPVPDPDLRAAVITVSDRASSGRAADRSGPLAVDLVRGAGFACDDAVVIPDGAASVEDALRSVIDAGARLVITTGGTGVGPRDETPEGTVPVISRLLPGVVEEIRRAAALEKPGGMLSRGVAGVVDTGGPEDGGGAFVVNLPGSTAAVTSAVPIVLSVATHVIAQLEGGDH
ncbi:molybdenum cofactor biosynthesis protein [Aeromicrobium sp. Root495]|uniref:MogA/MoaB family molybdenum cofactor biosynthesis protein n=1 Tax=Aeromicrobium sp. Root495 TaxID=1736550 RepID=UPI0006F82458|nr:MogA/MoaB family molybdenum cofactor biosynthesis protein [Aeromicrobium sp. Root495]KQY59825.1 molybdenum cofactor biosynthesis protein [Aeromicrobium sp. Root495]RYJ06058.1 MAG: MogA/MoaB family molybdenum cofactor biosynthesis protein [Actinomycetales bacterium]